MPLPPPAPATAALAALLSAEGRALVDSLMPYDPATAMVMLSRARSDPRWAGRASRWVTRCS